MVKIVKKFILPLILCAILISITFYINPISKKIASILDKEPEIVVKSKNSYYRNYDFEFVQNTNNFIPYSYQELLNIFYTMLNSGWEKFTFYCPKEYTDCLKDVEKISKDNVLLTHINNYVHPFNNFENIKTSYYESGEITISLEKLYSKNDIDKINQKIDEITNQLINENMSDEEKIKEIHDYIINNTKYDQERNENNTSKYHSNTAIGPLFEGYAICSGYADAMELFLEKLNIKSFKVASSLHIWNSVYLNNSWKQLDLTWDDPITNTNEDYLYYKYFLVDANDLSKLDTQTNQHEFDKTIYLELN